MNRLTFTITTISSEYCPTYSTSDRLVLDDLLKPEEG